MNAAQREHLTKNGGTAIEGQAYTTPSGERRIRLVDLKKIQASKDDSKYEVKLKDIILGGVTFEGDDNMEIRISPINMKGMAALQRVMGGNLASMSDENISMDMTIKIATVLINQDLPIKEHVTDDEVGRMLEPQMMEVVNQLVAEMINPLFAPAVAAMDQQNQATGA